MATARRCNVCAGLETERHQLIGKPTTLTHKSFEPCISVLLDKVRRLQERIDLLETYADGFCYCSCGTVIDYPGEQAPPGMGYVCENCYQDAIDRGLIEPNGEANP